MSFSADQVYEFPCVPEAHSGERRTSVIKYYWDGESVPRAVASGYWRKLRSLPLAVLIQSMSYEIS
jgi:hypothetical protein